MLGIHVYTSINKTSKKALKQVGLTPCQFFYFFFAAFTGFFALAFLTIFNMKICLLLYKFMLVDLSYLQRNFSNDFQKDHTIFDRHVSRPNISLRNLLQSSV